MVNVGAENFLPFDYNACEARIKTDYVRANLRIFV